MNSDTERVLRLIQDAISSELDWVEPHNVKAAADVVLEALKLAEMCGMGVSNALVG